MAQENFLTKPHSPGSMDIYPSFPTNLTLIIAMAKCTLATLVLLLVVLILIQETHIVEGRPLKSLGISSISKKVGGSGLNTSSKVETEDHSLDAFRPTKPGNSPGIGH
ncbi:hypothetical protein Bca101_042400 [Brassica carinata]